MISTESINIIHITKQQYGESILSEGTHLERTGIKYAKYTNHLRFSLRCHHNNLIPKHLHLKSRIKTSRSKQILDRASCQLLQGRININHNRRNHLKITIDHQTHQTHQTFQYVQHSSFSKAHTTSRQKELRWEDHLHQ